MATNGQVNPALFIDGVARPVEYVEGAAVVTLYPSARPLHLGAQRFPGWDYYGNNVLDEVALYGRALSSGEIQAIYAAGAGGKCPPLTLRIAHTAPEQVAI